MTATDHSIVGIMADSHGDPERIAAGADCLVRHGCTAVYHLGDICDTNRWPTADRCVSMIKRHGIRAVRGNNDHSLAADARGRKRRYLRKATIAFLENLPLSLSVAGATLVHSQPFIHRLGLSAMIGVIGRTEAERILRESPRGLLFRGHSHRPEIIYRSGSQIRFAPMIAGATIHLDEYRPCIVTCGALSSDFILVWKPGENRLTLLTFEIPRYSALENGFDIPKSR